MSSSKKNTDTDNPITRRLMRARNLLLSTSICLFDNISKIFERTEWRKVGLTNRLLTKDSIVADSGSTLETTQSNSISQLECGLLSAIVTINVENCWLTPCGYWKGPTSTTKKFEDLKLSFEGGRPPYDFLSKDFDQIIDNSKTLMEKVIIPNAKSTGFLVKPRGEQSDYVLAFRHAVFQVLFFL